MQKERNVDGRREAGLMSPRSAGDPESLTQGKREDKRPVNRQSSGIGVGTPGCRGSKSGSEWPQLQIPAVDIQGPQR